MVHNCILIDLRQTASAQLSFLSDKTDTEPAGDLFGTERHLYRSAQRSSEYCLGGVVSNRWLNERIVDDRRVELGLHFRTVGGGAGPAAATRHGAGTNETAARDGKRTRPATDPAASSALRPTTHSAPVQSRIGRHLLDQLGAKTGAQEVDGETRPHPRPARANDRRRRRRVSNRPAGPGETPKRGTSVVFLLRSTTDD